MHLFVTGATGFIGRHFVKAALAAGHRVTALRRSSSTESSDRSSHSEFQISNPEFSENSTRNLHWINAELDLVPTAAFDGVDALVHLAAAGVNPRNATWGNCFETNVTKSLRLWLQAADSEVRQFTICGSCFEYGRSAERYDFIPTDAPLEPTGPYHASKAAASMAAMALAVDRKVDVAILRPFHVFGEGEGADRFWPSLRRAAMAGEDFPMTPGEQIRDFIPVEDVAQAFLAAAASPAAAGLQAVRPSWSVPGSELSAPQSDQPLSAFRIPHSQISFKSTSDEQPATSRCSVSNVGTGRPQSIREFAEFWWRNWEATGKLLVGALPYRPNEVMRYVPAVEQSGFL